MNWNLRIPFARPLRNVLPTVLFAAVCAQISRADDTWIYAVQISAVVQTAPPQIALSWRSDYHIVTNYLVYRKAKDATSWGIPISLPGTLTNYTDTNVEVGGGFEYQIVKVAAGYKGYGYFFAGIQAPLTE